VVFGDVNTVGGVDWPGPHFPKESAAAALLGQARRLALD